MGRMKIARHVSAGFEANLAQSPASAGRLKAKSQQPKASS